MALAASLLLLALFYFYFENSLQARNNPNQQLQIAPGSELVLKRSRNGHYFFPGAINGQPVTFIVDTGAGLTSIPGSLAKPLGIKSCEPRQFSTAAGEVFGCVSTVAEVVFGSFRAHNVQVAVMPAMNGPALLGMNILGMVQIEQRGSALLFSTAHFREDD